MVGLESVGQTDTFLIHSQEDELLMEKVTTTPYALPWWVSKGGSMFQWGNNGECYGVKNDKI